MLYVHLYSPLAKPYQHSLRTVVEADLIIVLNHGEVVEQGTHQELLEKGGLYYDMWLEQATDAFSSGEEEEAPAADVSQSPAIDRTNDAPSRPPHPH